MALYFCELCDRYFAGSEADREDCCPGCQMRLREATEDEADELPSLLQQEALAVFTSGQGRIWTHD